jgi:RNA polymerase sigma-70 factor (ECF subfamily)
LLAGIARREEAALAALYDRYAPLVMGLAMQLTEDTAQAEILVAETFWCVWQAVGNGRQPHTSLPQWLFYLAALLRQQTT